MTGAALQGPHRSGSMYNTELEDGTRTLGSEQNRRVSTAGGPGTTGDKNFTGTCGRWCLHGDVRRFNGWMTVSNGLVGVIGTWGWRM